MSEKRTILFVLLDFLFHLHLVFSAPVPQLVFKCSFPPSCVIFSWWLKKRRNLVFVFFPLWARLWSLVTYLSCSFQIHTALHKCWKDEMEEIKGRKHILFLDCLNITQVSSCFIDWWDGETHCWFPLRGLQCTNKTKRFYVSAVCLYSLSSKLFSGSLTKKGGKDVLSVLKIN